MDNLRLSTAPISAKLLATSLIIVIGLTYLLLVVHIWIDTEMRPSLVAEAYGYMEYIELTDHAHNYMPYYSLFIFAFPVAILANILRIVLLLVTAHFWGGEVAMPFFHGFSDLLLFAFAALLLVLLARALRCRLGRLTESASG